MNLRISPKASDILITVYVVITLIFRFYYEQKANITPGLSIALGVCFLAFPIVLIKAKILNPNWFGMFKFKNQ